MSGDAERLDEPRSPWGSAGLRPRHSADPGRERPPFTDRGRERPPFTDRGRERPPFTDRGRERPLHSRTQITATLVLIGLAIGLVACQSGPHAWYRVDDFGDSPGYSIHPLLDFEYEGSIEKPKGKKTGAPARMVKFNDMLQVQCIYCHIDGDPRSAELTAEGTWSRVMMDLADRFKVDCDYCHDQGPRTFTKAGKFADRDMHIPERRWKCAVCHDVGFKVIRRS